MKKLLCITTLLILLTSCGNKDNVNDNVDTPNNDQQEVNTGDNTEGDVTDGSGTTVDINDVDQDQILEDLDNLLKEIIDTAENDEGTMSGTTSTGAEA